MGNIQISRLQSENKSADHQFTISVSSLKLHSSQQNYGIKLFWKLLEKRNISRQDNIILPKQKKDECCDYQRRMQNWFNSRFLLEEFE
jgi:hypothetical protein